jgi:hypothetical protein
VASWRRWRCNSTEATSGPPNLEKRKNGPSSDGKLTVGDVLLQGVSTAGMSDDSIMSDIDCYRVSGSQSYTTVTGATRTVNGIEALRHCADRSLAQAAAREVKTNDLDPRLRSR